MADTNIIIYRLEDLDVYRLAQSFSDKVWNLVVRWDSFSKFQLGPQFTQAADSISSNIAGGYGRYFIKDNIRFCYFSRGSILECKNWLTKSKNRNLVTLNVFNELMLDLETIHLKLNSYIKLLRNNLIKIKATDSTNKPINQ